MKKFSKIFLIIFIICCILLISFFIRNYMIINRIYNLQEKELSKIENSNNYLYEQKSTDNIGNVYIQIYFKDGIYKSITYFKDELDNIDYLNTNEQFEQEELNNLIEEIQMITCMFVRDNSTTKIPIFQFIKSKDNQYIISIPKTKTDTDYLYINKDTGIIEKWITNDNSVFTFKITENVVTDENIKKPESM